MRLLRRIFRLISGKCLLCGTRLTAMELELGCYYCLHCEARMDGNEPAVD